MDLIRRAAFFLANHLNAQSQYVQFLMLPEPDTEDTEGTSLEQPQDADSEVHSTT